MKRIALVLLFISSKIVAQLEIPPTFKFGFKNGVSMSEVMGDTYKGYHKFGYAGGIYVKKGLKGNWTAAIEAVFTQCGSRRYPKYKKGDINNYFLQLNYLEVPVLFQFNLDGADIEFGPGVGFLTGTKERITVAGNEIDGPKGVSPQDFNFNIGASYTFESNFGFNLRYTNSFIPIRRNTSLGTSKIYKFGQMNSVFTLCLTYQFSKYSN